NGVPCEIVIVVAFLRGPGQGPTRIIEYHVRRTYRYIGIDERASSHSAGADYTDAVALAPEQPEESGFPGPHQVIESVLVLLAPKASSEDVDESAETVLG